ncbi:hypothetical protein FKP32DRAFT_1587683 [Trametes sanguinea]|nr:hypothetical protein FKP32DRAFT_1587683 [Trametes sanguinea]
MTALLPGSSLLLLILTNECVLTHDTTTAQPWAAMSVLQLELSMSPLHLDTYLQREVQRYRDAQEREEVADIASPKPRA